MINKNIDKSTCMLLERRDLSGKFTINNIELTCLDNLREKYERQGDDEKLLFLEDWDRFLQDLEKQYQ